MNKKDTKNRIRAKPTLNFPKWLTIVASSVGVLSTLTLLGLTFGPVIYAASKKEVVSETVDFDCEDKFGNFVLPIQDAYVSVKVKKTHCLGGNLNNGTLSIYKKDVFYKTYSTEVKESKYPGFFTLKIKTASYNEGYEIYSKNAANELYYGSFTQEYMDANIEKVRTLIQNTEAEKIKPTIISETEEITKEESYFFVFENETDISFEHLSQYLYVTSNLNNFYYCSDYSKFNSDGSVYFYGKTKIEDVAENFLPVLLRSYNGSFTNQYVGKQSIIKFLEKEYEVQ